MRLNQSVDTETNAESGLNSTEDATNQQSASPSIQSVIEPSNDQQVTASNDVYQDLPNLEADYHSSQSLLTVNGSPSKGLDGNEQYDRFPSVPAAEFITSSKRPLPNTLTSSNVLETYLPLLTQSIDKPGALSFLTHSNWPIGFQNDFLSTAESFAMRFLLIDNSGSMMVGDGHKVIGRGRKSQLVPCTRWVELVDYLNFQARLSAAAKTPTEFRFLRQPVSTIVGVKNDQSRGLQDTLSLLGELPQGSVQMCDHINQLVELIQILEPYLIENNKKVCIMLATDGESAQESLVEALRPLQHLPVWLVVKLFSGSSKVLSYWDYVDRQLSLDIEVISDLVTEAKQVEEFNPWLVYGVPLHQLRLVGSALKELDLLDERSLNSIQLQKILELILPEDISKKIHEVINQDITSIIELIDNYIKVHVRPLVPASPSGASPVSTPKNHLSMLGTLTPSGSGVYHTSGSGKNTTVVPINASPSHGQLSLAPPRTSVSSNPSPVSNLGRSPSSAFPRNSMGLASPSSVGTELDVLTVWDPISSTVRPWIDAQRLAESFHVELTPKSSSCVIS